MNAAPCPKNTKVMAGCAVTQNKLLSICNDSTLRDGTAEGWSYGSVIFSHIMFYHDFAHVF